MKSNTGAWVYYVDAGHSRLMKVSIEGGDSVPIGSARVNQFAVSPDGTRLAINTLYESEERWKVDIVPSSGGTPVATLDLKIDGLLTWSTHGSNLLYERRVGGVENVWSVPLDGGEPQQLTHFDEAGNELSAWVMSPDGTSLAVSVGQTVQDIVLIQVFW